MHGRVLVLQPCFLEIHSYSTYFYLFLRVLMSIIMGALVIGQLTALSPDFNKGRIGAAHLFKLFNRIPSIDISSEAGYKPVRNYSSKGYLISKEYIL